MNPKTYYGPDPFDQPKIIQAALVPEMTLRDYFAGQALIGIITRGEFESHLAISAMAYLIADAMLDARTKPPTEMR